MNVINRLTEPGGVRRVELLKDLVVVKTYDREEIVFQRIGSGSSFKSDMRELESWRREAKVRGWTLNG